MIGWYLFLVETIALIWGLCVAVAWAWDHLKGKSHAVPPEQQRWHGQIRP